MYDHWVVSCCGCYLAFLQLWWVFHCFLYGGSWYTVEHKYAYIKIIAERPCKGSFYFIHSLGYSNLYLTNGEIIRAEFLETIHQRY